MQIIYFFIGFLLGVLLMFLLSKRLYSTINLQKSQTPVMVPQKRKKRRLPFFEPY